LVTESLQIMKSLSKRRADADSVVTDVSSLRNMLTLDASIHIQFDACTLALLPVRANNIQKYPQSPP